MVVANERFRFRPGVVAPDFSMSWLIARIGLKPVMPKRYLGRRSLTEGSFFAEAFPAWRSTACLYPVVFRYPWIEKEKSVNAIGARCCQVDSYHRIMDRIRGGDGRADAERPFGRGL